MNFRNWYEVSWTRSEREHRLLKDPRILDGGIRKVVNKMADNSMNIIGLTMLITGTHQTYQSLRANDNIAGNLLKVEDENLKDYTASVPLVPDISDNYLCKFIIDGPKAGSLIISHPPLLYDERDKILLGGQFVHELQHAIDWLKGVPFKTYNPRVDVEAYTQSIHEARAFIVQLKFLLKRFGNPQEVMAALTKKARIVDIPGVGSRTQPTPFRWENEIILKFAQELLKSIELNEAVLPTIGKALTAASMLMPSAAPQMGRMPEVQPQVAKTQDPNAIADYALNGIQKLGKKFFLENFVK